MAETKTPRIAGKARQRWMIALGSTVIALLLADLIVGAIFRSRMAAALSRTGTVDLHSRIAFYLPPYGVSLFGVHLSHQQPGGKSTDWFGASRVTLRLERLSHPTAAGEKFGLRDLVIHNGSFVRQCSNDKSLVVDRINTLVTPTDQSHRDYHFAVDTDSNAPASIHGDGSFDAETGTLAVSECSIHARLAAVLAQIPIGDAAECSIDAFHLGGTFDFHGTGSFPFRDLSGAKYQGKLQFQSITAKFHDQTTIDRADAVVDVRGDKGLSGAQVVVSKLDAVSGKTTFNLESASFATAADGQNWKLSDLLGRLEVGGGVPVLDRVRLAGRFIVSGNANGPMHGVTVAEALEAMEHEITLYPRDASIQPPKYPIPIQHINGGPIVCRAGVIRFSHLLGDYGGDKVVLDEAHITLEDPRQNIQLSDLTRQVRIDGMSGSLICHQPGPEYPSGLTTTVAQLRPTGTFAISGWYAINCRLPEATAKPKPDFFFHVSTSDGSFALTPKRAPITQIHGDATVSAMLVDITDFHGNTLGGTIVATAKVTPVRPIRYTVAATLYNVDVKTACDVMNYAPKKPIVGKAYLKTTATGSGPGGPRPPLATLGADGEFELIDGNFGDVTTIRAAAERVSKPDQSLDGQAAGVFSIRDEKITLENCAVGNPLFGLEGSGTIGFDKTLDLHAVAAPLGDWQTALKQSKVPIVEDLASDIAGSIQQLFAGAQRVILWDIQISGTTTSPKVTHVPAPAVTQPVAAIFGQLIRGGKDMQLIDQVRGKK